MAEKLYETPAIPTPSIAKLKELAAKFGMDEMPEEDLKHHQGDDEPHAAVYVQILGLFVGALASFLAQLCPLY